MSQDNTTVTEQDSITQLSRYYLENSSTLIDSGMIVEAQKNISKAFHHISPLFDSLDIGIPESEMLPSNELVVDLLVARSEIYKETFLNSESTLSLDSAITALNKAIHVLDENMMFNVSGDQDSIIHKAYRHVLDESLELIFILYNKTNNNQLLGSARDIFNRAKQGNQHFRSDDVHRMKSLKGQQRKEALKLCNQLRKLTDSRTGINSERSLKNLNNRITDKWDKLESYLSDSVKKKPPIDITPKAYIEYHLTNDYLFSLSRLDGRTVFYNHGPSRIITELIKKQHKDIINLAPRDSLKQIGYDLYLKLFGPLELDAQEFVIIPDGIISSVCFDILTPDNQSYLIETNMISFDFHFNNIFRDRSRKEEQQIICLSPRYSKAISGKEDLKKQYDLFNLYQAEAEITGLLTVWSQGDNRTTAISMNTLEKFLNDWTIFHYAGHAIANEKEAYLALSRKREDIRLSHEEIETMKLNIDLVTLSNSTKNLSNITAGEDQLNLERSFLKSGVSSVVASLWTVNEPPSSSIMIEFYTQLKKGKNLNEALRNAKLKFFKNAQGKTTHPYYWAGHFAVGNMKPLAPNWTQNLTIVGIFLLVVVLMSVMVLGRNKIGK
ncbi:MAG: CHAT domain-containing protein [Bacteroidia bacterium]|nr:CHAT domain-containing protein [Bacteroidia bacterium]